MSLKQIDQEKRILFLKTFTKELIKNTIKEELLKNNIKAEKIKQKYLSPPLHQDEAIKKVIKSGAFEPSQYAIEEIIIQNKQTPIQKRKTPKRFLRKPMIQRIKTPRDSLSKSFLKKIKKRIRRNQAREIPLNEINALQTIHPQPQSTPQNFNLGKINILLRDPYIQSIESSGPSQNVLIKKQNRITPTRIILTPEEIKNIINSFSQKANIPIVGGMLKAAVGTLIISAVTSEFVGSRFIISRITHNPNM